MLDFVSRLFVRQTSLLVWGSRYTLTLVMTVTLFAHIVACGSEYYQVSIGDDLSHAPTIATESSGRFGVHAPLGWQNLPIMIVLDPNLNDDAKDQIRRAMERWEEAIGKPLFEETDSEDGMRDTFDGLYASLYDGTNGLYQTREWRRTGKPQYVLATTVWDNVAGGRALLEADIRFNFEEYLLGDSLVLKAKGRREIVDLESLALHELGHFLGLSHVDPQVDEYSVMNPKLYIGAKMTFRYLSEGDKARIRGIYGCDPVLCPQTDESKHQAYLNSK